VLNELSDEQLMVRYQSGDTKAFEVLLCRHYQPLFHFLLRYTGNPHAAEDLLQDTFSRVIKGAKDYKQKASFKTWVYKIARNLTIDASRRMKHRRHKSLDQPISQEGGRTMLENVKDSHPSGQADRRVADKQFTAALDAALEEMNEDQRMVFVLREFQNLSFAEISSVVKAPENTVKSRMRYALEFLRKALAEFADNAL
jgi:RNA polymerase sigma-70 factor (ECF subfamily)